MWILLPDSTGYGTNMRSHSNWNAFVGLWQWECLMLTEEQQDESYELLTERWQHVSVVKSHWICLNTENSL